MLPADSSFASSPVVRGPSRSDKRIESLSSSFMLHTCRSVGIYAFVTAPATEVAGIYGLSTNAMPPQGDCFMASTLAVPDFTYRTSLYNLLSGVLRSSPIDPLEDR